MTDPIDVVIEDDDESNDGVPDEVGILPENPDPVAPDPGEEPDDDDD